MPALHRIATGQGQLPSPHRVWDAPGMAKPVSREFLANLRHTIEDGVILQRQGKLAEAEKIYTRILKTLPDQFETLQLMAEM